MKSMGLWLLICLLIIGLLCTACMDIRTEKRQQPVYFSASEKTGFNATPTESSPEYSVLIVYDDEWSGAILAGGNLKSIDGDGPTMYMIKAPGMYISVNAMKKDDSHRKLSASIRRNEEIIATENTNSPYGIAQTSISLY